MSIDAFRAALNGLVATTTRRNPNDGPRSYAYERKPKARQNSRARRNSDGFPDQTAHHFGELPFDDAKALLNSVLAKPVRASGPNTYEGTTPGGYGLVWIPGLQGSLTGYRPGLTMRPEGRVRNEQIKPSRTSIEAAVEKIDDGLDLVYGRPTHRAGMPGLGKKARRNMAVRMLPGGGLEFDTPEELVRYQQTQAGAGGLPIPRARKPQAASPAPRAAQAASAPRAAPRPPPRVRDESGPVSWKQAKAIGHSIGGLAAYCPELAGQKIDGGVHVAALNRMGLTAGSASRVLDALDDEKLMYAKTPAGQARARQILEQVGGVSCPVPGRRAAGNPRRWSHR
jgi:hypothetical protein